MKSVFLSRSLVFSGTSLAEIEASLNSSTQPRSFYEFNEVGLRRAAYSSASWSNGTVTFGLVEGGLINVSSAAGSEVVVGLPVYGSVTVHLNSVRSCLEPEEGMILLPGDAAIQALMDCGIFGVRIPISTSLLFRIGSMPYRVRSTKSRLLDANVAGDLIRLTRFFAEEHDRIAVREPSDRLQAELIGRALVERTLVPIRKAFGDDTQADNAHLEICLRCERALDTLSSKSVTAEDLAEIACCSVRQLYRAFDSVANSTPAEYDLRKRLNRARAALLATESLGSGMADLATRFGFSNPRQLSREYTREFEESPDQTVNQRKLILDRVRAGFA